ncbi:MAG: hypothetical protein ACYDG0_06495 [Vulcanimicrobiaceae bacterium]
MSAVISLKYAIGGLGEQCQDDPDQQQELSGGENLFDRQAGCAAVYLSPPG